MYCRKCYGELLPEEDMGRFPKTYTAAGDPWDILAYLAGGIIAGCYWSIASTSRNPNPKGQCYLAPLQRE